MELIFEDLYHMMQCRIYIREEQGSRVVITGYDGQNLVQQVLGENNGLDREFLPLLTIPIQMKDKLIKAFVAEGAKQNLRTENENLLKGKLDATSLHLDDMRTLSSKLICAFLNTQPLSGKLRS